MSEKTQIKGITVDLTEKEAFTAFAAMTFAIGHLDGEGSAYEYRDLLKMLKDKREDFANVIAKFSAIADRCRAVRRAGISSL